MIAVRQLELPYFRDAVLPKKFPCPLESALFKFRVDQFAVSKMSLFKKL